MLVYAFVGGVFDAFERLLGNKRIQDVIGRIYIAVLAIFMFANLFWPLSWYLPLLIGGLFWCFGLISWGAETSRVGGKLSWGRRAFWCICVPVAFVVGFFLGALVLVWPRLHGLSWF